MGEATIRAGQANPFCAGIRWHTSSRHPNADECDRNAAGSPYPVDRVPSYPAHSMCLCYLTQETEDDIDAVLDRLRTKYDL